jgi:hypothetical protein
MVIMSIKYTPKPGIPERSILAKHLGKEGREGRRERGREGEREGGREGGREEKRKKERKGREKRERKRERWQIQDSGSVLPDCSILSAHGCLWRSQGS